MKEVVSVLISFKLTFLVLICRIFLFCFKTDLEIVLISEKLNKYLNKENISIG